jgi:hypothetical protein
MALRAFDGKQTGLTSRSIKNGAINPSKLARVGLGGYAIDPCNYGPTATKADGYSVPTGATGDINILHMRDMNIAYHVLGAGQTILAPTPDSTNGGLSFGLDAAAAEGHQGVFGGINTAKNPFAVTIGTSPNATVRATLRAATVANVAELAIGWRKAETFQVNFDDYDELAALNVLAGDIKRETILNNAATVTVDTLLNALDAADFTLEVKLIGRQAIMLVNGAQAPIGAPFSFDVGEVVVPFYFFLQGGGASALNLYDVEVGPLYAAGVHDPLRK